MPATADRAAVLEALPLAAAVLKARQAGAGRPSPASDPLAFARDVLKHDHWDEPERIISSVFRPHSKTAVKACHASSKTFTAADCIAIALQQGADVVTTAPTQVQVEKLLWGQLRRSITPTGLDWGTVNLTEVKMPGGNFALGIATKPEEGGVRFQGYHARPGTYLLLILDEAPGVNPGIWEAVQGISAGGDVRQLLLGNPVIASGPFFDVFAGDAPGWERFTIDAFDTPNLAGVSLAGLLAMSEDELDDNPRPYLVDRRWVRDRYQEWGEDHPLWQSRVRGRFPLQAEDALLSLSWLEAAKLREPSADPGTEITAGVDVAGPGEDETTLVLRRGYDILHQRAWSKPEPRGDVIAELTPWVGRGLKRINVDKAGLGWYFFLDLKAAFGPQGVRVRGINVGEASDVKDESGNPKFRDLKAELYWAFRLIAKDEPLAGHLDQVTISQLAGIRYEHDARGRIVIESKENARKRGVKSPDRAEAVILAFAPPSPSEDWASAMGRTAELVDRRLGNGREHGPARSVADEIARRRRQQASVGRRRSTW